MSTSSFNQRIVSINDQASMNKVVTDVKEALELNLDKELRNYFQSRIIIDSNNYFNNLIYQLDDIATKNINNTQVDYYVRTLYRTFTHSRFNKVREVKLDYLNNFDTNIEKLEENNYTPTTYIQRTNLVRRYIQDSNSSIIEPMNKLTLSIINEQRFKAGEFIENPMIVIGETKKVYTFNDGAIIELAYNNVPGSGSGYQVIIKIPIYKDDFENVGNIEDKWQTLSYNTFDILNRIISNNKSLGSEAEIITKNTLSELERVIQDKCSNIFPNYRFVGNQDFKMETSGPSILTLTGEVDYKSIHKGFSVSFNYGNRVYLVVINGIMWEVFNIETINDYNWLNEENWTVTRIGIVRRVIEDLPNVLNHMILQADKKSMSSIEYWIEDCHSHPIENEIIQDSPHRTRLEVLRSWLKEYFEKTTSKISFKFKTFTRINKYNIFDECYEKLYNESSGLLFYPQTISRPRLRDAEIITNKERVSEPAVWCYQNSLRAIVLLKNSTNNKSIQYLGYSDGKLTIMQRKINVKGKIIESLQGFNENSRILTSISFGRPGSYESILEVGGVTGINIDNFIRELYPQENIRKIITTKNNLDKNINFIKSGISKSTIISKHNLFKIRTLSSDISKLPLEIQLRVIENRILEKYADDDLVRTNEGLSLDSSVNDVIEKLVTPFGSFFKDVSDGFSHLVFAWLDLDFEGGRPSLSTENTTERLKKLIGRVSPEGKLIILSKNRLRIQALTSEFVLVEKNQDLSSKYVIDNDYDSHINFLNNLNLYCYQKSGNMKGPKQAIVPLNPGYRSQLNSYEPLMRMNAIPPGANKSDSVFYIVQMLIEYEYEAGINELKTELNRATVSNTGTSFTIPLNKPSLMGLSWYLGASMFAQGSCPAIVVVDYHFQIINTFTPDSPMTSIVIIDHGNSLYEVLVWDIIWNGVNYSNIGFIPFKMFDTVDNFFK